MKKVFIIILLILVSPIIVNAHPGRTDSNGCHTCRTNCSKWGLSTGEYHCHNGSSSKSSGSKSSTKTTTVKKVVSKSKNTNLGILFIDGKKINIKSNMTYKTSEDSVSISAITEDSKATIEYDKDIDLEVGNNNITVKVIAEDTKYTKKYNINIIRLSSDTGIEIFIDDNKIEDNDVIEVSDSSINLDYKTNFEGAKVEVIGDYDDLVYGKNEIKFIVTAEDGTEKEYNINIIRLSNDTSIDIFINDKSVENNDIVEVSDSSINLDYKTGYEGAKVEVIGNYKKLVHGKNKIKLIVTAEDGTKEEYNIIINRNYKNKLVNSLFKFKLNNNIKEIFTKVLRLDF